MMSYIYPPGGVCVRQSSQVQAVLHIQLVSFHRRGHRTGTVDGQRQRTAADLGAHLTNQREAGSDIISWTDGNQIIFSSAMSQHCDDATVQISDVMCADSRRATGHR